ncbi:MAG: MATE family efflux transporter [Chitinophagales bacterium]
MNKEILRLAIPNIISNVSVPLLSSIDTALMGRFSEVHIGAVGIGAMVFNFLYWSFGFLRMGTTGITAQAYGKADSSEMMQTLGRAMLVGLIGAVVIFLLQVPFTALAFPLMNIEGEQLALVERYFYIRIWDAPATLGLFAMMGWFFGMQNAVYPMVLTIAINWVNIVVSYLLIYSYGMDIEGVAWGTVIAQYVGLLLAGALFAFRYRNLWTHLSRKAILEIKAFKAFLNINSDIFIRTLCLTFAFGFFYSQSAKGGDMVLAVNVILLQFVNWMAYAVDGFAFASESLVGKYKGANDSDKLDKAILLNFAWGMAFALLFSVVYGLQGSYILQFFTNQADVFNAALPFLFWMVIFPLLSTPCFIWDGVFIGLTASKSMKNAMLLSLAFYLAVFYAFDMGSSNDLLWLSLLILMVVRGVIQTGYYWWKGVELE